MKPDLEKSDIYSLGLTLLAALIPLLHVDEFNDQKNGNKKTKEYVDKHVADADIKKLLLCMLDHDENMRYNYKQILELLENM